MEHQINGTVDGHPRPSHWLVAAAVAGFLHATITFYWALGGRELLWTMGHDFIARFSSFMWLLFPLGAVKAAAAIGPLIFDAMRWPLRRATRALCWVGAAVLVAWGGMNTLVGNAVLLGLVHPQGGFDRSAMIGHAWIWDPLFLAWGLTLLVWLFSTRKASRPTV